MITGGGGSGSHSTGKQWDIWIMNPQMVLPQKLRFQGRLLHLQKWGHGTAEPLKDSTAHGLSLASTRISTGRRTTSRIILGSGLQAAVMSLAPSAFSVMGCASMSSA